MDQLTAAISIRRLRMHGQKRQILLLPARTHCLTLVIVGTVFCLNKMQGNREMHWFTLLAELNAAIYSVRLRNFMKFIISTQKIELFVCDA
jgi:hypothetical protein